MGKQSHCSSLAAGFWREPWNPKIVDELAAHDILLQFLLHRLRRGREEVKKFMVGLREAFHDLEFHGASDLVAEGDYVVGHCEGGGTHTGAAFIDFLSGFFRRTQGERCNSGAGLFFG